MIKSLTDTVTLANGVKMPKIGLGVWHDSPAETPQAIMAALKAGYLMIDASKAYENEAQVGTGIQAALKAVGKKREDIFIATKLENEDHGYQQTLDSFAESLKRLQTDYVDLYLIHWPVPGKWAETWRAMEQIYHDGRARAIGVCNFTKPLLQELMALSTVKPMVDQVEFHPWLQQTGLKAWLAQEGIQQEAWSPLGGTGGHLMQDPVIQKIAQKHGKSAAQVLIRWDLQNGVVTIPKSVHPEYIEQNAQVFDFELDNDDLLALSHLEQNKRTSFWLDSFDWYFE